MEKLKEAYLHFLVEMQQLIDAIQEAWNNRGEIDDEESE